jgi:hypothetical protein
VEAATAVVQEAQNAEAGAACTTAAGAAAGASNNGQDEAKQTAEPCPAVPNAGDPQLLLPPEQQPLQWHHRAARARSLPAASDASAWPAQQALVPPGQPLAATPSTAATGVVCHVDVVNVGKPRRLLLEMPLPAQLCGAAATGGNPAFKSLQRAPPSLPAASSSNARQQLLLPLHDRPGWSGPGAALAGLPGGSNRGRPPTLHTSARAAARPAKMHPLQPAPVVGATGWQQRQPQHQQQQQAGAWHAWQHQQMGWWQQWPAGWQYSQPGQQPKMHWGYGSGHLAWQMQQHRS